MKRLIPFFTRIFSLALIIQLSVFATFGSAVGLPREKSGISSEISASLLSETKAGSISSFNSRKNSTPTTTTHNYLGIIAGHQSLPSLLAVSAFSTNATIFRNLYMIIALLASGLIVLGILLFKTIRAQRHARFTEKRFRSLLEANPSAIMIFQNFKLRFVNESLESLTGYTRDELLQMEVWELIHPSGLKNINREEIVIEKGSFSFRGEFQIITKSLEKKWVHLSTRSIQFDKKLSVVATAVDITESKKTSEKLVESELRYKNFYSKNSAVMLITDPESGQIKDANQAAVNYYGYSKDDLLAMNIRQINTMTPEKIEEEKQRARDTNSSHYHFIHRLANGSERDVEIYTSKIMVQDTMLNFSIIFDVTERRRMEAELKKAKDEAEEANRVKSFFVSNVSHEIRTPLNAIIGLTDLIIENNHLSEELMENMRSIKYSSDHLLGVINDVLDFSKLEAGKVELETTDFDLFTLINESVKTVQFKAREKGISINTDMDSTIPPVLKGDPSRLRQIVLNLLSNAVKFTQEGHIDVSVKLIKLNTEKVELRFSVSDTGIGIPEDKQSKLFQSFTQAENDTARKFGGTGLGLSISKKLVELQKGQIGLKSVEGMGSTFWFCLEFGISERTFMPDMNKIGVRFKDLKGIKILLVEDDHMNQFVMKRIMHKWQANIDIASNGLQAIAKLEKNDYHLVLMDLHMPELNGYEAAKRIRNEKSRVKNHQIPILALTADVSSDTRQKVKEAGMNDFITKPSEQNVMYEKIAMALSNIKTQFVEKTDYAPQDAPGEQVNMEKTKARIRKALSDIFDDDLEGTIALIVRFLKEIPRTIVGINDAFYEQDLETVNKLVHKIKPGYSYMGFSEVSLKIERIQELTHSRENLPDIEQLCKELDDDSRKIITILREIHKEFMSETKTIKVSKDNLL